MATVTKGRTFTSGETVTPAKLNDVVDLATVTNIQTADIADGQITTAKIFTGTIVDSNISASAAISGTKINPQFGSQNIGVNGLVTAEKFVPTAASASGNGMYLASANTLGFSTNGTGAAFINSGGNLCVGTSSDFGGYKLSVLGNSGSAVMRLGTTGGAVTYALFNYNGSVNTGSITTDTVNTSYNITSDYRLKENVRPIDGALDRLQQLNPVRFSWKQAPSIESEGFIAHELQEVVPSAVTGQKDAEKDDQPEYQGVDLSKLVPLLVSAVQELAARVSALENK
jgi:hypothetical protein